MIVLNKHSVTDNFTELLDKMVYYPTIKKRGYNKINNVMLNFKDNIKPFISIVNSDNFSIGKLLQENNYKFIDNSQWNQMLCGFDDKKNVFILIHEGYNVNSCLHLDIINNFVNASYTTNFMSYQEMYATYLKMAILLNDISKTYADIKIGEINITAQSLSLETSDELLLSYYHDLDNGFENCEIKLNCEKIKYTIEDEKIFDAIFENAKQLDNYYNYEHKIHSFIYNELKNLNNE